MVERIRITPSQIVTRDASNNITFNTDYSYLKTGSGTLYAGGYQRAPVIFGQNTITDHTEPGEGWFTPYIRDENLSFNGQYSNTYYYEISKGTYIQWALGRPYLNYNGAGPNDWFVGSNIRYAKYFNNDTYAITTTPYRYQWIVGSFGFGDDGYGGYSNIKWCIWPAFVSTDFSAYIPSSSNGGSIMVEYDANEYLNYSRQYYYSDEYGNRYVTTQYGLNYYGARSQTDGYGNYYNIPASPMYWRKHTIYTIRNPVALSLSVTP